AVATLEALADRGARGFVTTHYQRLKTLGYEDGRFRNASVGVDPSTQRPSYVLQTGTPGASNPLVVAERLGFDGAVVERAKALSMGNEGLAQAVEALERARGELAIQTEAAAKAAREREREAAILVDRQRALEARSEEALAKLTAEVTEEARAALAAIRAQVRDVQQERDPRALERRRRTVLAEKERLGQVSDSPALPSAESALLTPPEVGDLVKVLSMAREGAVLEVRGDGAVVVGLGSMKVACSLSDVAPAGDTSAQERTRAKGPRTAAFQPPADQDPDTEDAPLQTTSNTCDLRGVRRHEVVANLGAALDRAFRDGHRAYWVIHGMGTGAVRAEVRGLLPTLPYVRAWRPGRRGEGDDGITLVWLDTD
ncbi:MAG: Smr/MutS family protein, partial [Myxococcota bacterium]|nr:Smr/MutS family protein [Myxococcota bacterium]